MPLVGHQHQIDIQELTDKGDGKGRLFDRLPAPPCSRMRAVSAR